MTDESQLGVGTEQPAAPSESAQITVDEAVVNSNESTDQSTETVVASEPASVDEQEWIEGSEFGDEQTRIPYNKQLGRKYFMQVEQMGGEAVFNATREITEDLVSGSPDAARLAQKIHSLNPDAYQQLGQVLLDATLEQKFGKGVTFEMVQQALEKPAVPESEPFTDDETEYRRSPEDEAKLKAYDELMGKFPEVESKANKFGEMLEQQQAEKVEKFGQEIITEAMSPLGKLFEDAGLKVLPNDTPEEISAKQEIAEAVYERAYQKVYRDPNNKSIVDETEAGIRSQNSLVAKKHMLKLQARIEREAARQIQIFTGRRAQSRNLQTQNLNNETPTVVPGNSGAAAFAVKQDTTPAFDESRAAQVFDDILARQGVSQ
jgi:hypothetical protein